MIHFVCIFVGGDGPFEFEAVVRKQFLSHLNLTQGCPITDIKSRHIGGPHGPVVTVDTSPEIRGLRVLRADKPVPAKLEHVDTLLFIAILRF